MQELPLLCRFFGIGGRGSRKSRADFSAKTRAGLRERAGRGCTRERQKKGKAATAPAQAKISEPPGALTQIPSTHISIGPGVSTKFWRVFPQPAAEELQLPRRIGNCAGIAIV